MLAVRCVFHNRHNGRAGFEETGRIIAIILETNCDGETQLPAMPVHVEETQSVVTRAQPRKPRSQRVLIVLIAVLACLAIAGIVAARKWPFTQDAITQALRYQAGGDVQIGAFHQMLLPKPGCVAEHVVLRHPGDKNGRPYLTIDRLKIVGTYHGLLTDHISFIRADGFHVIVTPSPQSSSNPLQLNVGVLPSGLTIGKIFADGAQIEFAPTAERKQALIYRIPKLVVHDLAEGKPLSFEGTVQVPQPPAEVDVSGKFAAWHAGHGGESETSGAYNLKSLDLGAFHEIGGIVTSKGNFKGTLQHIVVDGTADTPDFTVSSSGHPIHINGDFNLTVNGLNGDVDLDAARVQYGHTVITGAGSVSGQQGVKGKVATFELSSNKARVEDLLWMFISENKPPMTGPIIFRAKATIPPGHAPFLNRVNLQGDFGISNAQYPHPDTQRNIDVLSARARGQADKVEDTNDKLGNDSYDPGRVLANIKGHVVLNNTIAHLSDVSFAVPGALANVSGTYALTTERIDLHGDMRLDSELSKTTTGVKSFLLKVAHPFMKKARHASVVAIRIGGTYQNPTYVVVPKAEKK